MPQLPDRTKEPATRGFGALTIPAPGIDILPNGIELYSIAAGDQPINRLTVSYGSGLLETRLPDALHLATQLLREGTASYAGSAISETLDYHGAWFKSDALSHNTAVNLWSLNNSTAKLLPLLKEMLFSPQFPEKAFVALRQKHKAKFLLSQKNVSYAAAVSDKKLVFGAGHPINRILDTDEIDALTVNDIREAWQDISSAPPKVFLAGDIKDLMPEIVDFLSKLDFDPARRPVRNIVPMKPEPGGRVSEFDVDAEHQAAIAMSIPSIDRDHPDYIGLRLVVMALGGYFGSRLMSNIREDKGYTYGIQANLLGYREGGVVSIMTNTAPAYINALIDEVRFEICRLRDERMGDEELAKVKSNAMTSLAAILDTPFSIMDHHISQFHTGIPPGYFSKQVGAISRLTADDIIELSRKYLDVGNMLVSIARPAAADKQNPPRHVF